MEISKEFIDQFLKIVNQQSNSMVRSKAGFGKFSINEVLMDYRNSETLFTLDYTELHIANRTEELGKHQCIKYTFIGDPTGGRSQFYQNIVEWFIFSKTVKTPTSDSEGKTVNLIGASDLINYGIGK